MKNESECPVLQFSVRKAKKQFLDASMFSIFLHLLSFGSFLNNPFDISLQLRSGW